MLTDIRPSSDTCPATSANSLQPRADVLDQVSISFRSIGRTRIYLVDIAHWEAVGKVHGEVFGDIRPAASILEVSRFINPDWLVEIEADAVVPSTGG